MALEKVRFENRFDFEFEIDPDIDIEDAEIPPMLLQPLLENAVIHAFDAGTENGRILLKIGRSANGFIICTVEDNGTGIKSHENAVNDRHPQYESVALETIRQRLELLKSPLGKSGYLKIMNKNEADSRLNGTKIEVYIPLS
jgi:two-component system LytT family sensor kinase